MNRFKYLFDPFKTYKYIRIFVRLILHPMNIFGYSFFVKNNIRYTLNLNHLIMMMKNKDLKKCFLLELCLFAVKVESRYLTLIHNINSRFYLCLHRFVKWYLPIFFYLICWWMEPIYSNFVPTWHFIHDS